MKALQHLTRKAVSSKRSQEGKGQWQNKRNITSDLVHLCTKSLPHINLKNDDCVVHKQDGTTLVNTIF